MQIVLLCIAEKWLVLSLPTCMIVVYAVQKVYLRTSRQLRYLELEARAGVYSSFLESVIIQRLIHSGEQATNVNSFRWRASKRYGHSIGLQS